MKNYSSAIGMIEDFNDKVKFFLRNNAKKVKASDLGLDERGSYSCWVTDDCIIVPSQTSADYYWGFEYVSKDCRTQVGDYIFYFDEDSRVRGHLDRLEEKVYDED